MEPIVERCCGLDVHQATIVACLVVGLAHEKPRKEVRTFSAMTRELLKLRDWLVSEGCTHVAMESTGVYWKPVYALLEDHFELIVGNAQHMKNVPGRKTDVKDSEWIANLLRHGLIAKSFVPPKLNYATCCATAASSSRAALQSAIASSSCSKPRTSRSQAS